MAAISYDSAKSNSLPLRVELGKGVGEALLTGQADYGLPDHASIGLAVLIACSIDGGR